MTVSDSPSPASPSPASRTPETDERVRRQRAPGAYLPIALWQRFALAGVVAVALMAAMVVYVTGHNTDIGPPANPSPAAAAAANRDAAILIGQDQAPRHARLGPGVAPAAGLQTAIHRRLASQVHDGSISGPVLAARCRSAAPAADGRQAFNCAIVSGGVIYPFAGVVETNRRQITFCKRDLPPVGQPPVPVSPLCRS